MQTIGKENRNVEADIMKGIAILCVMIGHAKWLPMWLLVFIYSFHIPLFFIIAGCFAKTYEEDKGSRGGYVRRSVRQLVIPYAVVSIVCLAYTLLQSIYYGDYALLVHDAARYVLALDAMWPDTIFDRWVNPIWFLLALFWARLFFYYLSSLWKWFIPLCVALSVTMIMIHPYIVTPFCIGRGVEALVFMVIGWAFRRYSFPVWSKVLAIGCWLVSMYLGKLDLCAFEFNCLPIDIIGVCGGTLVIYYISKGIAKTFMEPFFSWCGRNSLILLCAHTIEYSTTIVHVLCKLLPFKVPMISYYGIKHGVTVFGSWVYTKMRRRS